MKATHLSIGAGIAAALMLASTGVASAHHCYKQDWADAAYQHHQAGGTAWVSLSDLGAQFLIPPELEEDCGWAADSAVADFMEMRGLTQEPLIHSKVTTASGAYNQGKGPAPFSYLEEADFELLGGLVFGYLITCSPGGE